MQAIEVKYHGPTSNRPARYTARCDAGSLTLSRHCEALARKSGGFPCAWIVASKLCEKLGWTDDFVGGELKHSWVFVFKTGVL